MITCIGMVNRTVRLSVTSHGQLQASNKILYIPNRLHCTNNDDMWHAYGHYSASHYAKIGFLCIEGEEALTKYVLIRYGVKTRFIQSTCIYYSRHMPYAYCISIAYA